MTTFTPYAKPRAFALRPSFTKALYDDSLRRAPSESLIENLDIRRVARFEEELFASFTDYVGLTLGEAARRLSIPPSRGKGFIGGVLKRAFGAESTQARIKEFEEMGITLRATRVSPDGKPYEAMSFPAFRYKELVVEEWEESTLLQQLTRLLMVPCVGAQKSTPHQECVIQRPILWIPSPDEMELLRNEWEMFRNKIRDGHADALPTASMTKMIHVRPHGRDSSDTDEAPVVGPVVKKSFWLNSSFVARLVERGMVHA